MKKALLITILSIAIFNNANAQWPAKINKSVVVKLTATWCGPCGQWGFPFSDQLIDDLGTSGGHAFFMASYASGYTSWHDSDFFCQAAQWWDLQLYWGAVPAFSCDFKDKSMNAVTSVDIENGIMAEINSFQAKPVVASTGYTVEKLGNIINVVTRTQFWADATGDYYIQPVIVEDSVEHSQNGQTDTAHTVPHRWVMREGLAATDGWGDMIASGNISANQTFDKSYSYTVTNPSWNVNKLKVVVILFKKNGGTYSYVNGNDIFQWATDVKDVNTINNISLYPNPAVSYTDIAFNTTKATNATITVTDMLGHIVFANGNVHFNTGENEYRIDLSHIPTGFYTVNISSDAGKISKYFSVTK